MPIRVKCESCKKTLSVKDHLAGKKIKCPVCQTVVAVPLSTTKTSPITPGGVKPDISPLDKTTPNGTSTGDKAHTNGTAPPENVEEEAASAFADEPAPAPVEDETPKTIDFTCNWCDEKVQLPIEMGGKQVPCPNQECRRIIKVPMPKVVEKKDWRKMDRRGPAAAIISQPEQLEDAWGTQEATRARQDSLAKAGAIELPPKKPIGAFGWLRRGFIAVSAVAALALVGFALASLYNKKQQQVDIKEAEKLVEGKDAKIKHKLLSAEAHRAIALLYLRKGKAFQAKQYFEGAQQLGDQSLPADSDKNPGINEQLFFIDLALSEIELGGEGDDILRKTKLEWNEAFQVFKTTLEKIKSPDAQVIAMREVGTRLLESRQPGLAVNLAAGLKNKGDAKKPLPVYRQQIALFVMLPDQSAKAAIPEVPDKGTPDSHARVGHAEGFARKGNFDKAYEIAQLPGSGRDRLDAYLGVTSVALQDPKRKGDAVKFFKEALSVANEQDVKPLVTPWQKLQLVKLGARVEDSTAKEIANDMPAAFKARAYLEIFLALGARTSGRLDANKLADLEAEDKADGITLALGWMALAEHNARLGANRTDNRKTFEDYAATSLLAPAILDRIRPMIDIGTFLGSRK